MTANAEHNARRVVAVVGGAGGIGQAIAQSYARRGCRIALIDHDPARLATAAANFSKEPPSCHACDITDDAAARSTIERIVAEHGRLDVLVQSAGLTHVSPAISTEMEVYRRVMAVNFWGVVATTQAALPALRATRGRLIVLSSVCGFAPLVGRTGYCASKHALHGFFDTLRCELRGDGVSVTIACPSFVDTDFAARGLAGDATQLSAPRSTTGALESAQSVGEAIVVAAEQRRRLLVLGRTGRMSYWLSRLAPGWYERLMLRSIEWP